MSINRGVDNEKCYIYTEEYYFVIKSYENRYLLRCGWTCHTEWSKSPWEVQISYINTHMWYLEKWNSVQFSSVTQSCLTLCNPMNQSMPGLPVHHQLPEFTETHVHWVGDASSHLILCRPLLLLPPIPPSIRVFSNESTLRMRWPEVLQFQL